jgi:regulator of sigma E protease
MLLTIISFIVVFTLITLAHEGGHLLFAKLNGIRVYEFGLGFGPPLFQFKHNGTVYKINLLPILGYVKIAGIDTDDPEEAATPADEKYFNKGPLARFLSIFGGPLCNLILGFIIFSILFAFIGIPTGLSNEIAAISPNSPAAKAGLASGDRLIDLNGKAITSPEKAIDFIHNNAEKPLSITVSRGGKKFTFTATPKLNKRLKVGLLGFSLNPVYQKVSPASALIRAAKETWGLTVLTAVIIGKLFVGQIGLGDLAGPVGIAQITGQYASSGLIAILGFISFFSINVAVLNLIPLPALDGGRLFFIVLGLITRRPINIELENKIHAVGMTLLLAFIAVLTFNDKFRIFKN